MKEITFLFALFLVALGLNAPSFLPLTSPGYNVCYICILNGETYETPH